MQERKTENWLQRKKKFDSRSGYSSNGITICPGSQNASTSHITRHRLIMVYITLLTGSVKSISEGKSRAHASRRTSVRGTQRAEHGWRTAVQKRNHTCPTEPVPQGAGGDYTDFTDYFLAVSAKGRDSASQTNQL
jgi:hypothetical protein